MAEAANRSALLDSLERDAVHVEDLRNALADLRRRCAYEGIEFAVVGALAMRQYGYVSLHRRYRHRNDPGRA